MGASGCYSIGYLMFILYRDDIHILNIQGARWLSLNSFLHVNANVYVPTLKL